MKTVYLYNPDDSYKFYGPYDCHESPLEPGEYIVPTHCTEVKPPYFDETKICTWNETESEWVLTDVPVITNISDNTVEPVILDAVTKLKTFLTQNPDVAELLK